MPQLDLSKLPDQEIDFSKLPDQAAPVQPQIPEITVSNPAIEPQESRFSKIYHNPRVQSLLFGDKENPETGRKILGGTPGESEFFSDIANWVADRVPYQQSNIPAIAGQTQATAGMIRAIGQIMSNPMGFPKRLPGVSGGPGGGGGAKPIEEVLAEAPKTFKPKITFRGGKYFNEAGQELDATGKPIIGGASVQNARVNPQTGEQVIPGHPTAFPIGKAEVPASAAAAAKTPTPPTVRSAPVLPPELKGAKPRYNVGPNEYIHEYESDLDKALYIIAQKKRSPADAKYLEFVMKHTGLDEAAARKAGEEVKARLKELTIGQKPGPLKIPTIYQLEQKAAEVIPPTGPVAVGPTTVKQVIASIPKTGNIEFDSLVNKLQILRAKAANGLTDLELEQYQDLANQVRNHPLMPPELNATWKSIGETSKARGPKFEVGDDVQLRSQNPKPSGNLVDVSKLPDEVPVSTAEYVPGTPPRQTVFRPSRFTGGKPLPKVESMDPGTGEVFDGGLGQPDIPVPNTGGVGGPPNLPPVADVAKEMAEGPRFNGSNFDDFAIRARKPSKFKGESWLSKLWNLPRAAMSTDLPFITSAGFRQGNFHVGTKRWLQAWVESAKAYGSSATAAKMEAETLARPYFRPQYQQVFNKKGEVVIDRATGKPALKELPSLAERAGLRRGTFDEKIRSEWMESLPGYGKHIAASNRQFRAFLNHIGDNYFETLIDSAKKAGNDPEMDERLLKSIGELVNTSLKRGTVGLEAGKHAGDLEKHINVLSNLMFSPRNTASEIRMLNPSTYLTAPPMVRNQYLLGQARRLTMWATMATGAKMAGASVSFDPTNPDFLKIRIGDHRIDPPGGLQQFIVFAAQQIARGKTSSNEPNRFKRFGSGYGVPTAGQAAGQFGLNRAHPSLGYLADLTGFDFQPGPHPIGVLDRSAQLAAPMFAEDIMKVIDKDPELAPIFLLLNSAGIGTQSYGKDDDFRAPSFIPKKYDWTIGTGK